MTGRSDEGRRLRRRGGGSRRARARTTGGATSAPRAHRRVSRLLVPVVLVVATAGALLLGVLPTRSYLDKRAEVQVAEAELAALQAANAVAEAEAAALDTDAEIERRAREEFGLARPGEETYVVLPPPADPVEVPDGWPFTELQTRLRADG